MSSRPMMMRIAAALLFFFAACLVSSAQGFQAPWSSGVIHALLVADSDSNLGDSVLQDVRMLGGALEKAFEEHSSRLHLEKREGKSVKASEILSWFRNLNPNPDDTLLFYYSGHGEIRPDLGHVLALTNAENGNKLLPRSDILSELKSKKTRLVVVLTDCCSTIRPPIPIPAPQPPAEAELVAPPPWAVAGCLFLQHRGVVDITASCPGQAAWPAAWPESSGGGIFTGTFADLLDPHNLHSLDKNKDGFIEWNEFYPELEKRTQQDFVRLQSSLKARRKQSVMPEEALSEDEKKAVLQPTQKIWTCSVLPFLRVGVRVLDSPGGLKLEEIYPGTPASTAQRLKKGDTIVGVGDKLVQNEREFLLAVDGTPGDKPIVLKVRESRAAPPHTVTLHLRDNDVPADVRLP